MKTLSWIIICLLVAIAAAQAGWIVRDRIKDDTRERLVKVEGRQTDLHGRVVVLEGPPQKAGKRGH